MNNWQPDLCVAIDFGTTYTGVSWVTPKEQSNRTNIITRWPGEARYERKVPTVLAKDVSGGKTRWGFLCKELAEDNKWRLFKLLLDPATYEKRSKSDGHEPWLPETMEQVYRIVALYLSQIYTHIRNEIPELIKAADHFSEQLKLKTWDSLTIDFTFSTPTTWEAPISHRFKDIVSKAGFGEHKLHKVALGLTEPEAAAVFTCQPTTVGKVQKGHVVLSIDAGGGTADLAFVKATANTADSLTLEEILPVNGVGVGSTKIDSQFANLIEDRIKNHPKAQSELPRDFPVRASQSDGFQAWKHALGSAICDQPEGRFATTVAGLNNTYSNQDLDIKRGKLYFTREQLERCFDTVLEEVKGLIKEALEKFEASNRKKGIVRYVHCVVLSGGLGGSDYVLEQLTMFFRSLGKEANSCVAGTNVFRSESDPRTVVSHGLLYDRIAKGRALGEHIARANYGIIVEEPRSRGSSPSQNTRQYPANTTIFLTDRIRWLVKFGDTIQVGRPITVDITKRMEKSDQRGWTEKIVWLGGDRSLPKNAEEGREVGMEELHSVDIEVRKGTKMSSGARTWWGSTAYHKCHFNLSLAVGPSGDCDVEVSENVMKRSG